MKQLSYFARLAVSIYGFVLMQVLIYTAISICRQSGAANLDLWKPFSQPLSFHNIFLMFSQGPYIYEGSPSLPILYQSARKPKQSLIPIQLAYLTVTLFTSIIVPLSLIAFKDKIQEHVLLNLPATDPVTQVIIFTFIVQMIYTSSMRVVLILQTLTDDS